MAQAVGPCRHMGDQDGTPGSWLWPGIHTAAAGNWGHESVNGRSLCLFSLFTLPFK